VPYPWQLAAMREALRSAELAARASSTGLAGSASTRSLGFAQALLCETPGADGLGCGTCAGCHLAIAGEHPDLMRLN
jgi:DNA polymerase-3 subunit delta'